MNDMVALCGAMALSTDRAAAISSISSRVEAWVAADLPALVDLVPQAIKLMQPAMDACGREEALRLVDRATQQFRVYEPERFAAFCDQTSKRLAHFPRDVVMEACAQVVDTHMSENMPVTAKFVQSAEKAFAPRHGVWLKLQGALLKLRLYPPPRELREDERMKPEDVEAAKARALARFRGEAA